MSILAGIMISIACTAYLSVGGVAGALLFATGLLGILFCQMKLFTGKAGLLVDGGITLADLGIIWLGNFIGTGIGSLMLLVLGMRGAELAPAARSIIENRMAAGDLENVVAGIICGILMYIATANWEKEKNVFLPIMCVAAFILIGGNHCVADMGYFWLADNGLTGIGNVLSVSLGNLIGCNLIPGIKRCIIS